MDISRNNIVSTLFDLYPQLIELTDPTAGVYEIVGNFAIYLGTGIENNTLNKKDITKAIHFINKLAIHQDVEIHNILVVGIFETLCNYEYAMNYIKQRMNTAAKNLYNNFLN